MIITLDVSAAVEVVMGRPRQPAIAAALEKAGWVVAPALYVYEAANVMWKYHQISGLPKAELSHVFQHMVELVDEFIGAEQLAEKAITLACELNHPVYDAVYLVACQNWNAALLTLDTKLALTAARIGIQLIDLDRAPADIE